LHEARAFFQLRNIRKVYRADTVETIALDNITLDIREGEFVALMGPSGCGKSTLLNIVAMLDTPSGGCYTVGGAEVSASALHARWAARVRCRSRCGVARAHESRDHQIHRAPDRRRNGSSIAKAASPLSGHLHRRRRNDMQVAKKMVWNACHGIRRRFVG
jgi:ABC-type glutathione transport system ATPase component